MRSALQELRLGRPSLRTPWHEPSQAGQGSSAIAASDLSDGRSLYEK
jgi:hypothetical protein